MIALIISIVIVCLIVRIMRSIDPNQTDIFNLDDDDEFYDADDD